MVRKNVNKNYPVVKHSVGILLYFVGESACVPNLLDFTLLAEPDVTNPVCTWQNPPVCVMASVSQTALHYGEQYCLILALEGTNGLRTYVNTQVVHHSGYPKIGKVIEVDLQSAEPVMQFLSHTCINHLR